MANQTGLNSATSLVKSVLVVPKFLWSLMDRFMFGYTPLMKIAWIILTWNFVAAGLSYILFGNTDPQFNVIFWSTDMPMIPGSLSLAARGTVLVFSVGFMVAGYFMLPVKGLKTGLVKVWNWRLFWIGYLVTMVTMIAR